MSLIEQAAKRLEQLRQAGVQLPDDDAAKPVSPLSTGPLASPAADSNLPTSRPTVTRQASEADAPPLKPPARRTNHVQLNMETIAASGLLVPTATRSLLANELRLIKRPLIANATGRVTEPLANGNLIMVTSALPGEGKSFTAINLAMSIAMELDNSVLLVDADVARPSVLNMLGLPPAKGFLDVLGSNSVDISSVLLSTNVEKLSILPCGTLHDRATELLASDIMNQLLEDISTRYPDRIVIFDSPPLLLTTEARALATHMGQIVMVVHAGATTQAAVKEALATVEACPVKMIVLNQVRQSASERYGYGYAYGYGYGHEAQ